MGEAAYAGKKPDMAVSPLFPCNPRVVDSLRVKTCVGGDVLNVFVRLMLSEVGALLCGVSPGRSGYHCQIFP